jgi:hypothetical protein
MEAVIGEGRWVPAVKTGSFGRITVPFRQKAIRNREKLMISSSLSRKRKGATFIKFWA